MHTSGTLTLEQIGELKAEAERNGDRALKNLCRIALDDGVVSLRADVIRDAKRRLADILNARAKEAG